jgi:hypothetical protein
LCASEADHSIESRCTSIGWVSARQTSRAVMQCFPAVDRPRFRPPLRFSTGVHTSWPTLPCPRIHRSSTRCYTLLPPLQRHTINQRLHCNGRAGPPKLIGTLQPK